MDCWIFCLFVLLGHEIQKVSLHCLRWQSLTKGLRGNRAKETGHPGCRRLVRPDSMMSSAAFQICRSDNKAVNLNRPLPARYRQAIFVRAGSPGSRHQGGVESAQDIGVGIEWWWEPAGVGSEMLLPVLTALSQDEEGRNLNRKGHGLCWNASHLAQAKLSIQKYRSPSLRSHGQLLSMSASPWDWLGFP